MAERLYICELPKPDDGPTRVRLSLSEDGRFTCTWQGPSDTGHGVREAAGRWQEDGGRLRLQVAHSELPGVRSGLTLEATAEGNGWRLCEVVLLSPEPPPDDPCQRHEAWLEEEKFRRSLSVRPSRRVR